MVKKSDVGRDRGAPVSASFMAPQSMAMRAAAIADAIDRTGKNAPSNGGPASMSHVYRLAVERGLEALEKEMKR